jgi:hypothetical protein
MKSLGYGLIFFGVLKLRRLRLFWCSVFILRCLLIDHGSVSVLVCGQDHVVQVAHMSIDLCVIVLLHNEFCPVSAECLRICRAQLCSRDARASVLQNLVLVVVVTTSFVRALLVQLGRDSAICTDDRPSFPEQKFGLGISLSVCARARAGFV